VCLDLLPDFDEPSQFVDLFCRQCPPSSDFDRLVIAADIPVCHLACFCNLLAFFIHILTDLPYMLAIIIPKCARMIFNRLLQLFYFVMQVIKNTIQIKLVHFGELLAVDFVSLNIGLQDCLFASDAISISI